MESPLFKGFLTATGRQLHKIMVNTTAFNMACPQFLDCKREEDIRNSNSKILSFTALDMHQVHFLKLKFLITID